MSRTTKVVTGVALAGMAGAAGLVASGKLGRDATPPPPETVSTATADVRRGTIAERRFVNGTLGYAGAYTVPAAAPGTLTWVPPVGATVRRGDVAFEVDGQRVTLLYGDRPAWRDLASGVTDGDDVQQLETNLSALGFGTGLTVDRHFTAATATAVRRWQQSIHATVTGTVALGSVVFLPGALRVAGHDLQPGEQAAPGATVEHGTSDQPAVTVAAPTSQLGWLKVGDQVVVTLPDNTTRNGAIAGIGATSTSSTGGSNGATQTTAAVTVKLDGAAVTGFVDQASVQVWVVRATHTGVLTVPVNALNSIADGKYEVIVVDGDATRRVPVKTGLFDDYSGRAEVSGDGLSEGQKVQVPRDDA